MLHCSVSDIDAVSCPLGKGGNQRADYDFVVASIFSKVYVNGMRVDGARMLLLIVRKKEGKNHVGRKTLKYNPKMTYRQEKINEDCYRKVADKLGLDVSTAAWFIDEINVHNQDEVHLTAYVGGDRPLEFSSPEERKRFYLEKIGKPKSFTSSWIDNQIKQTIFFGTPGSGKSHKVDEQTKGKKVHRTTFHPDSDYASFVGCYKPTMSSFNFEELLERLAKEDTAAASLLNYRQNTPKLKDKVLGGESLCNSSSISYEFIPQVFTEAYIDAWKNLEEDVCLVIEEINRGNCAQIFGDLFQLLDRNSAGYSDYRITADRDLRDYLARELGPDHEGIQEGKLCLPPNLHILATMNTSDQSLFPMDSAFKRRWDWEYVPVEYRESVLSSSFTITLGDKVYRWVDYLRKVNELILKVTGSEDKQMGNFFIKRSVSKEEFKSKVMFYLWSEVCRDEYGTKNNFFRSKTGNEEREFSFNDLYKEEDEGLGLLHGFMDYLEVKAKNENEGIAKGETTDEQ